MTSKTNKSVKDNELGNTGYADFGNQGYSQPMYSPATSYSDRIAPISPFSGPWIDADSSTLPLSNDHYPSSSTAPFQCEPIDNFTNHQSQFHVPWQKSSDQCYTRDNSETSYQYGVRHHNQNSYRMPGIMWDNLNDHALTTGHTQTGAYVGFASHYGAGPESIANRSLAVLPGDPSPAPTPMPLLDTKPHACIHACGKAYARKGDMKRHARSHEQPGFWCVVEGCKFQVKGFYRKDKWVTHLKTHGIFID